MPTEMEHAVSLLEGINEKLSVISNNVLTKREQFIKDAPPAPSWFTADMVAPVPPKSWMQIEWPNEELKNKVRLWHSERNFDLQDDAGKEYQTAWEAYEFKKEQFDEDKDAATFFAWRIHYADIMIAKIERTNPKLSEL